MPILRNGSARNSASGTGTAGMEIPPFRGEMADDPADYAESALKGMFGYDDDNEAYDGHEDLHASYAPGGYHGTHGDDGSSSDSLSLDEAVDDSGRSGRAYSCELDGSAHSQSSLGTRSSFIRRMIEKQKQKGNWNESIAPDDDDEDGAEAPVDADDSNAGGTDAKAKLGREASRTLSDITLDPTTEERHRMQRQMQRLSLEGPGSAQGSDGSPQLPLAFRKAEGRSPWPPTQIDTVPGCHNDAHANHNKPSNVVKRALSSTSLVTMLKIQAISEDRELHDDIDAKELAETVRIRAGDSVLSSNVSEFTDDGGHDGLDDSDDSDEADRDAAAVEAGEKSDGAGEETDGVDAPSSGKVATVLHATLGSSTSSFLPSFDNLEERSAHFDGKGRKGSPSFDRMQLGESEHGDSSTFYLQSITSRESRTHASDAPDYDYYSISSEEGGGDNDGNDGAVAKDAVGTKETRSDTAPIPADPAAEKLGSEVCEVLGLPKDHIRKVHRGIMSRDTELRLRQMVEKAQNEPGDVPKKVGNESNGKTIEERDDEDISSNGSEDGVFGPAKNETEEEKWERIRLERQKSRNSKRKLSSGSVRSGLGNIQGEQQREKIRPDPTSTATGKGGETGQRENSGSFRTCKSKETANSNQSSEGDLLGGNERAGAAVMSKPPAANNDARPRTSSHRANRKETHRQGPDNRRLDESERRGSDSSTSSSIVEGIRSRLGFPGRRFSPEYSADTGGGASGYASDGASSSEDEDDEAPSWDRNILTEGEYYVAMSMLVYIYSLLRETSMLGHTDIAFDEIDVNSFQSDPGFGGGSSSNKNKFLSKTKTAGFIIRVVMDELEKKGAFSSVEKNEGDKSVLKEFKQWVMDSRSKQLDDATERTIKELRRKVARRRWKRAINAVRLMVRLGASDSNSFALRLQVRRNSRIKGSGGASGPFTDSFVSLAKTLRRAPRTPQALSGSMTWMHDQRKQILSSLGVSYGSSKPSQESLTEIQEGHELVGENDIKDIINEALEEPRFFLEGSLLSNLIESGIEVVWFGDRHPNDVVYSICVNRQYKRVSVVFRGTVNSHNWMMNMKFAMSEVRNPIAEAYPGRTDMLGLHTGFSLYMMRQRKDDSLTKIEEIFSNIDSIGRELAPDGDYQLSITGHSLGGALATILSFYAATSNIFSKITTIRVFTYAAPRVGCQRFLRAFQHLERIGKLRMARFTNTRDVVPLIPFHGFSGFYKHVGMHIRLLGVGRYAQYWLRQALDVSYPKSHSLPSQLWRGLLSSVIRNSNTVQGYKRNHTLSEYQKRIRFALEYRSALAQAGGFFHSRKRSRLKTLDDYYFIKGASHVTCTGELTRVSLEDRAKESVCREARKWIILFALISLLETVILFGVLKNSVRCDNYPILLYPLYLLTGCRDTQSRSYTTVPDVTQMAFAVRKKRQRPLDRIDGSMKSEEDAGNEESLSEEHVEDVRNKEAPSQRAEVPIPNNSPRSGIAKNTRSPHAAKKTESWASLMWNWLREPRRSNTPRPLCVWGHCNLHARPYQLWGVGVQHPMLLSSMESIESPPEMEQGLS